MSLRDALGWTALIGLALAGLHLVSPFVREWARERASWIEPLSAGALAAYIFLHLLPSLADGEAEYGGAITVTVLAGFVVYYTLETAVADRPRRYFGLKVAIGWGYSFLIVYSLPGTLEESPMAAVVSAVALGAHVLQSDHRLASEHPGPFDGWGRFALATAPLVAIGVDVVLRETSDQTAAYLSAFASGVLLLSLFRDAIDRHQRLRALPWFLAGLAAYGGLLLIEEALG